MYKTGRGVLMVHVVQTQKMKGRPCASLAPFALIILVALIGQYNIILYKRLHDIKRENVSLKDQHAKLQSRLSNVNNPATAIRQRQIVVLMMPNY